MPLRFGTTPTSPVTTHSTSTSDPTPVPRATPNAVPSTQPNPLDAPLAPSATPAADLQNLPQAGAGPAASIGVRTGGALPWRERPERSTDFIPVATQGLHAPIIQNGSANGTLRFPVGSKVRAEIGSAHLQGSVQGYDYKGRAVLDVEGKRRTVSHEQLSLVGPSADRMSVLASLPLGAVVAPPVRLREALNASLDVRVNGAHSAREYMDAFHDRGYEVFVVGGGVRDAIRTLNKNPQATQQDLLAVLNDIDIVTTAPPPVARQICEEIAPELDKGGVWSPQFVEQFGVVLAGGKKAGQTDSEGLDICSMKTSGSNAEMQVDPDTGERCFPTTFGNDLLADAAARDFCCNALYYDPFQQTVVDPTLQGIADAEHELLHPVEMPSRKEPGEPSLSARFWKFRLRGFRTDGESLAAIRHNAQMTFSTRTGKQRWQLQNALGRTAPKDAATEDAVATWLGALRNIMFKDHCADLFDRAIQRGVRKGVIASVLKRTTKGQTPPTTSTGTTSTTGDTQ